ncbi:MAG TPA: tetratricopeptide repeat protein [Acidobacteriaceae bacterium]|nr:tetratricopeptide repeat protein [Acidobacteriaceae bacterium]
MKAVVFAGLWGALVAAGWGQRTPAMDAQKQAALNLEHENRIPEAEAAWRAYSHAHPGDPEPWAQMGLLEARQEHYARAIPLYQKALQLSPHVPGLRLNLGLALFKDGRSKEAIAEFKTLLKTAPPASPEAQRLRLLIGMAYYGMAEYTQAIPYLKRAAAQDKENLPLRLALAHSCLWSKEYPCVMETYREILTLNAESAEADMLAGEALDAMRDDTGALAQFRAAEKANPKEPYVHFAVAYVLMAQKRYADAVPEFQADLEADPRHAQARVYLADCYVHLEDNAHAQPELERALKDDPSIALGHLDLGIIYAAQGRNQEALAQYLTAIRLNPQDADPHWRLSRLYQAMGETEKARAEAVLVSTMKKQAYQNLYQQISGPANHAAEVANPPQ